MFLVAHSPFKDLQLCGRNVFDPAESPSKREGRYRRPAKWAAQRRLMRTLMDVGPRQLLRRLRYELRTVSIASCPLSWPWPRPRSATACLAVS